MDQAPAAPRALDTAPDSEDEHTLMRPATAPLPADAYRDSLRTDPEPSVGTPLELVIQEPKPAKRPLNLVWLLAAASLCAGGYVVFSARDSGSAAAPTANAAPEASLPAKRELVPPPPPKTGNLEPPIGTTYDPDTAAEDDALLTPPQQEARKAARARLPRPVHKEPAAAAEPGVPSNAAAATAPGEGNAAEPAGAEPAEPAATKPVAAPAAAAPTPVPSEPTGSAPSKPAAAAAATTEGGAAPAPAAPAPSEAEPPAPGDSEPAPPAVDRENPY